MPRTPVKAHRVQVYLTDAKIAAALAREARAGRMPVSQAAGQAIARGLRGAPRADPEDRLLRLELGLRDHMRAMGRDMQIVQELVVELARAFFLRLPDVAADDDPLLRASVEARIERLLDATAARIVSGRSRDAVHSAEATLDAQRTVP
ncbi:hypothetical protein [Brevundimonas bacteroides]|uniref:hypothetical protein n=1 Tax=Brevundimonas bacteroides TaxID=74311 RepID=UPI000497658D|nr:hypothetical protein [Brevundimonas bacteroides]